jgi:putative tricarboxylic transport membrane protein
LEGKRRARLVTGVLGLVFCAGYVTETLRTLSFGHVSQPGAAVFPVIAAGLLAVASAALVFEQLRAPAGDADGPFDLPRGPARWRVILTASGLVAYVALAPLVGHLAASVVLCAVLVAVVKPAAGWRIAVTAIALALSVWVVFVRVLNVALPSGPW